MSRWHNDNEHFLELLAEEFIQPNQIIMLRLLSFHLSRISSYSFSISISIKENNKNNTSVGIGLDWILLNSGWTLLLNDENENNLKRWDETLPLFHYSVPCRNRNWELCVHGMSCHVVSWPSTINSSVTKLNPNLNYILSCFQPVSFHTIFRKNTLSGLAIGMDVGLGLGL